MNGTHAGDQVTLGFTVKSGWASAVLIGGSATSPHLIDSRRIELSDPALPESRQPYHAGFGTAREAGRELSQLVKSVERCGTASVMRWIRDCEKDWQRLKGAGVVVGSLIDPESIANAHIRIHALEGQLFRGVVQEAAARAKLECSTWRERDLYRLAAGVLPYPESELRARLTAFGRSAGRRWRAEEKAATLAAWLVLAGMNRGAGRAHLELGPAGVDR